MRESPLIPRQSVSRSGWQVIPRLHQNPEGGYTSRKGRATGTVSFTSHISTDVTGYRSRPQSLSSCADRVVVAIVVARRSCCCCRYRFETVYHASRVIGRRQDGASGYGDCSDERSDTRCCCRGCRSNQDMERF